MFRDMLIHRSQYDANLSVRRVSGVDWVGLSNATSMSIYAKGLHIKPTTGLQNATKSSRINGFVFVGTNSFATSTIKGYYFIS